MSVLGFKSWRQFPTLLDENVVVLFFFSEKNGSCVGKSYVFNNLIYHQKIHAYFLVLFGDN